MTNENLTLAFVTSLLLSDYFKGHVLTYGQSVLYTWDDPTKPHELECSVIEVKESATNIKLDLVSLDLVISC